ncbi:MAG: tetratricopeptide repeat protein [Betaproteobacteria bacterium]|nr:tetratricopeptide repeat protein [Betaproteobacteria bacterium]
MIRFPDPRTAPAALCAALLALSFAARADEVQEASKLLRSGQHQQALERVNKALAAKPKDAQARFLKGLIFAEQGNPKEATEIFLKLTQDYPDLPEPYNNLAVIYAAQGQYDKARAALEQSIRTHPSYATAYENLGDVYAKLASQAYDKALQIDSANAAAKNKLALVRDLVGGAPPASKPVVSARKEPAKPPVEAVKPPAPVAALSSAPALKPAPEKPAAAAKSADAELIEAVNAWAKAWSSKNADAYLASYASDFRTPKGEPREAWAKLRRQRISAPRSIAVSIESPKVSIGADGQASVTFRQGYRSDLIKSTSTKTLVMVKSDGRWLIRQEKLN